MNNLPVLNQCLDACGECCSDVTPLSKAEADKILAHLNMLPKFSVKRQLKYSHPHRPMACAFLTPDTKCFVYDARPRLCQAFGHVKKAPSGMTATLRCPHEKDGKVRFESWTEDRAIQMSKDLKKEVDDFGRPMVLGELAVIAREQYAVTRPHEHHEAIFVNRHQRKEKKRRKKW